MTSAGRDSVITIGKSFSFVFVKRPHDFRRKFADPIDSHANRDLCNHCLIPLHLPFGMAGFPGCRCDTPCERTDIRE